MLGGMTDGELQVLKDLLKHEAVTRRNAVNILEDELSPPVDFDTKFVKMLDLLNLLLAKSSLDDVNKARLFNTLQSINRSDATAVFHFAEQFTDDLLSGIVDQNIIQLTLQVFLQFFTQVDVDNGDIDASVLINCRSVVNFCRGKLSGISDQAKATSPAPNPAA